MKPLPWHKREARLIGLFSQTFPNANSALVEVCARKVGNAYSNSPSIQIEGSDKNPAGDRKKIEAAQRLIEKAVPHLRGVGWHGGKAIKLEIGDAANAKLPLVHSYTDTGDKLASHLEEIAKILRDAALEVPPQAEPIISANKTKKPKTAAKFTARAAACAFYLLSDKRRPTVPNNDGTAYGPYLEFLGHIFEQLELIASAETWAAASKKWFKKDRKTEAEKWEASIL